MLPTRIIAERWTFLWSACCMPCLPWQASSSCGMLPTLPPFLSLIVCRTIYRTAEFADGFQGKITSTQSLFSTYLCYNLKSHTDRMVTNCCAVVFDSGMITLAMVTLNIFHPGDVLQNPQSDYDQSRASTLTNLTIPWTPRDESGITCWGRDPDPVDLTVQTSRTCVSGSRAFHDYRQFMDNVAYELVPWTHRW
jgi:hypothetical protein